MLLIYKEGGYMKKLIARLLATIAVMAAGAASIGCLFFILDEPVAPKSFVD